MASRQSAQSWRAVADWVDGLVLPDGTVSISILPHISLEGAPTVASSSIVASAAASSVEPRVSDPAGRQWLGRPSPPAVPPTDVQLARGREAVAQEEEEDDEEEKEVTDARRRRRSVSVHRGTKIDNRKRFASVACQTDPEEPVQKRHPKWVSFERRPEVWSEVLQDYGVDVTAGKDLFLLATHSDAGWQAANSIIAKLLKKKSDGEVFSNVSGFVHTCVTNARNEMGREASSSSRAAWSSSDTSKWGSSSWK